MIEQRIGFCSTKKDAVSEDGTPIDFIRDVVEKMNEQGFRATSIAYNPSFTNRVAVIFDKEPTVKVTYNEVDI